MQKSRPTIADVAQRAGVSPIVVSRVCHPRPKGYVAAATRQRVLDAIRELNYHPDSRARYLRSGRTDTIGFYTGYGTVSIEQEFARVVFDGLQAACGELNQDLLLFHPLEREPIEIARFLGNSKVDGVVYHPRQGDGELAIALRDGHKPIVRIGEPFPNIPSIVAEDYNGAVRLAHHLYLRGHRRVLFRKESSGLISAGRRYDGFCDAARHLNMEVLTTQSPSPDDTITWEEEEILLRFRTESVTAVACWRDYSAVQVLLFCRRHRIHVPEDLAVAGFDGLTPDICPDNMRLTTVVIDWHRILETAVARLIDIIEKREAPDELLVPGSLYVGNTT